MINHKKLKLLYATIMLKSKSFNPLWYSFKFDHCIYFLIVIHLVYSLSCILYCEIMNNSDSTLQYKKGIDDSIVTQEKKKKNLTK